MTMAELDRDLIIQPRSPQAEAYSSVAEHDNYALTRMATDESRAWMALGGPIPENEDEAARLVREREKRAVIRTAVTTLDTYAKWKGWKFNRIFNADSYPEGQRLEFPRYYLQDRDGYSESYSVVPDAIKEPYILWAMTLALDPKRLRQSTVEPAHQGRSSVKADTVGIVYDNQDRPAALPSYIRDLLSPYVKRWYYPGHDSVKFTRIV